MCAAVQVMQATRVLITTPPRALCVSFLVLKDFSRWPGLNIPVIRLMRGAQHFEEITTHLIHVLKTQFLFFCSNIKGFSSCALCCFVWRSLPWPVPLTTPLQCSLVLPWRSGGDVCCGLAHGSAPLSSLRCFSKHTRRAGYLKSGAALDPPHC